MRVVELVAVILLAVAGLQAAIWIPLILWFRSRSRRWEAALRLELATSGETLARGPERANYEGASFGYPQVKGSGVIVLTDRRLLFRKATGGMIEVPLEAIAGLREAKTFLSAWRGGRPFLILQLASRAEVGFMVNDHPAWMAALGEHVHA